MATNLSQNHPISSDFMIYECSLWISKNAVSQKSDLSSQKSDFVIPKK